MSKCICGCGNEIVIKKQHKWLGMPKYISGHNSLKGEKSIAYKTGHTINNGYIRITSGINNWRYEHDVIMEQKIGRKLTQYEVVHHVNGIKTDNRIENLKLTTFSEHQHIHPKIHGNKGRFENNASYGEMEF